MACVHCGHTPANRGRGLCWCCFYKPEIRALYSPTSKYANRGTGDDFNGGYDLPEPTTALPGSPEKVEILCQRAQRRVSLWHPLDGLGSQRARKGGRLVSDPMASRRYQGLALALASRQKLLRA